jgi:hypothetical protein
MKKTRIQHFSMTASTVNATFKKQFDDMLLQVPDGTGSCIIIGYKGEASKIIDLIKSPVRLRKAIRTGSKLWGEQKLSRYRWIQEQVRLHQFDAIKIQIID